MYNIYLIHASVDGLTQWKVGLSKHPEKRINELKTANPNITHIHALYEISDRKIAYKTEAMLKNFLKPFKINGEWVEQIALNDILFFEYCERYEQLARTLITIKNNKNFKI
jgi:hypothetical protein